MRRADITVNQLIRQACKINRDSMYRIVNRCVALIKEVNKSGVIHNDINLDNIMFIRGSGKFVLIDFSFARHDDSFGDNDIGMFIYSLRELSKEECPEQLIADVVNKIFNS